MRHAAYYYYASDLRIASLAHQRHENKTPTGTATENGAKLWRAARLGQLPRVQRLLKLGADVAYRCDEHGTTALHQAVGDSHKDVVEALLEADASVDDVDFEGKTALHFATVADIVVALIMAGADVDHEDHQGKTPGRLALDRNDAAVVEALIDGRADPSKIYEPREDVGSRLVTSGNQSDEEGDPDLQHYHFREAHDPSDKNEQNTGGRIPVLAKELDVAPPTRSRNRSSLPKPGDCSKEQAVLHPHTNGPGREQMYKQDFISHVPSTLAPKASSHLPASGSTPALDVRKCDQGRRLIIAIVSSPYEPTATLFERLLSAPEDFRIASTFLAYGGSLCRRTEWKSSRRLPQGPVRWTSYIKDTFPATQGFFVAN